MIFLFNWMTFRFHVNFQGCSFPALFFFFCKLNSIQFVFSPPPPRRKTEDHSNQTNRTRHIVPGRMLGDVLTGAWMSQEVSKRLGSVGYFTPIYVGYNPVTNHLLTSWDILVMSVG